MTTSNPITVRKAFDLYYEKEGLSKGTQTTMKSAFKLWEKFTENPPIDQITNVTVANFRQAAIDAELSPVTVNTAWRQIRSVLRRVGPVTEGNPWGLELIPRVPAMRPVPEPFRRPRRLSMEELSRLYLAARHMNVPNREVSNSGYWWQALIVLAYFTGLRISDLLKAKWSDLNEAEATLFAKTAKTGAEADLPLPPVVMVHLARLDRSSERIFNLQKRLFHRYMLKLKSQARLNDFDGFHDIRRTAASEADRVKPGMGKVLTLHAPCNVTERSYLNAIPELREVVEQMEVPPAFRHGPKMTLRMLREARKVVDLRPRDFTVPISPPKELFAFTETGFAFCGNFYAISNKKASVLRPLVENDGVCTQRQLWEFVEGTPYPEHGREARRKLWQKVAYCREFVRKTFKLPPGFNPIVATMRDDSSKGCRYELKLPPILWESMEGGAA